MREQKAEVLHIQKIEVIDALMRGSNVQEATQAVGIDRTTYYLWIKTDPDFVAELNRRKSEHAQVLRHQMQALVPQAIETMRDLLTNANTPPVIRLKTATMVLASAGSLEPETHGPLDPEEIRRSADEAWLRL